MVLQDIRNVQVVVQFRQSALPYASRGEFKVIERDGTYEPVFFYFIVNGYKRENIPQFSTHNPHVAFKSHP